MFQSPVNYQFFLFKAILDK
uniref:Uncharacterized protein n=1 Tax=Anguilla anguilla TaxID=7936 RepID=A0A0E9XIN8_ANGAN